MNFERISDLTRRHLALVLAALVVIAACNLAINVRNLGHEGRVNGLVISRGRLQKRIINRMRDLQMFDKAELAELERIERDAELEK